MDCQQAQNDLLSAESLNLLAPELSAHLAECANCQALLEKLRHLEAQAKTLPIPAGHEQPSAEFLRQIIQVAANSGSTARRGIRRLIAAAVVLAFALAATSLIFFNGSVVQADVLIGQLVDWNLAIAHTHDAAGRARVYQQQLLQLQQQVNHGRLAPADQALAAALLNNAQWMTTEENASDESRHFQALADQLLARQQAASDGEAAHLQQIYQQLIRQGVGTGAGASINSPTSAPRTAAPTQAAQTLALPKNMDSVANQTPRLAIPASAAVSGDIVAVPATHAEFFAMGFSSNDASANSFSHVAASAGSVSLRGTSAHAHHGASHISSGDPTASSTETQHLAPAQTASSSPPAARNDADANAHDAMDGTSPPAAALGSADGSDPPQSSPLWTSAQNPPHQGSHFSRLASLQSLSAFDHAPRSSPPPDLSLDMNRNTDWPPASLLTTGGVMSRQEIDAVLRERIDGRTFAFSDMNLPHPPPMGTDAREFFDSRGLPPPIPFPEPALGLLPLLAIPLLRRRRRAFADPHFHI